MQFYGNIIHKKEIIEMGSTNQNDGKIVRVAPQGVPFEPKREPNNVIQISLGGVIAIVVTIAISAIGATWIIANRFGELESNVSLLHTDVSNMQADISDIQIDVNNMHDYLYNDGGVKDQLGEINKFLNIPVVTIPDDKDYSEMKKSVGQVTIPEVGAAVPIKETTQLGLYMTGEPCYARDVVNEPILLTYTEEDKEIYFYGMYNENYHWEGYCITNAYLKSNGSLVGICESNFEDGKRLDYMSLYRSSKNSDKWIYSNRSYIEEANAGVNIHYVFEYENSKNFTNTNVRVSDILYVDKFIEAINPQTLTYYFGNTSNGVYEDHSGNSYEAIYNDDGTIKTLYRGDFSGGTFNDTGYAWDIAYVEETGYYVQNTGTFSDGSADKKSNIPLSMEDINKIISQYEWDCELNWKQD